MREAVLIRRGGRTFRKDSVDACWSTPSSVSSRSRPGGGWKWAMDLDRVLLGEYMASDSSDAVGALGADGSILSKVHVLDVIVVSFAVVVVVVVVKVKMGFCVEEEEESLIVIGAVLSWDRWDEGSALCSGGDTRTDPTEPGI